VRRNHEALSGKRLADQVSDRAAAAGALQFAAIATKPVSLSGTNH